MDASLLELRNRTYAAFVDLGRAPSAAELGNEDEVRAGWRQLHEAHALVLNPATDEIRMANPFSAVPTAYRVEAGGRWWYANCAWDAFGILSALGVDGRVESSCPRDRKVGAHPRPRGVDARRRPALTLFAQRALIVRLRTA